MSEYDDIHKSESTPVKVGVDLPGLIAACGIADGVQESFPSGHDDSEALELGLVSWKLYWDDATSAYNLYEPKVVVPGGTTITATGATGISAANTYYCRVDKSGDTYTATVVTSSTGTANTVALVPICEISANGVTQFHTGVVNVSSSGTSLTGETAGSQPVSGNVGITGTLASGESLTSCGIEFETVPASTGQGGVTIPAKVVAKMKGRDATESDWGAKLITYTGTDGSRKTAHVLACGEIEIQDGGGEGGKNANVIGSDYVDVDNKTEQGVTKRQVKAKIATPDTRTDPPGHALLTDDTNQLVRCKKTFLGTGNPSDSSRVEIDGPNAVLKVIDADGQRKIVLDASDIPSECGGSIGVHEIKYKDENGTTHTFHGLFCEDIDLTKDGKLISNVSFSPSSESGGVNTVVFTYTDGTTTTVTIRNGLDGAPGSPGADGVTPVITAQKSGKVTSIFCNGVLLATINDGNDGTITDPVTEQTFITDISFSMSDGELKATVHKAKGKIINLSDLGDSDVEIITATGIDVVTSESYDTDTRTFTNTKKNVMVLSVEDANGDEVFTATPHQ